MFSLLRNELKNTGRIYGLDALRALAIIIVLYEHGNFILEKASPSLASIKIIDGVDLFFVLSGFLVGGILLRGINRLDVINFSFVKNFLIRRWFRTLPNYFLFLILNIALVLAGLTPGTINKYAITFFVFMQNFFKPYDFFFWESWSLTIEEWFYLLFPLMLLVFFVLFRRNKKYLFLGCTFLLILFSTLIRFYHSGVTLHSYAHWDLWTRKLVITRFDSIGFGLLACWIHFYFHAIWANSAKICFVLGAVLYGGLIGMGHRNDAFSETWYFTFSALAGMLLLPLAEQTKQYYTPVGKFVTFISLTSYAMYLVNHGIVASLIKSNMDYALHPVIYYVAYWTGILLLSAMVYNYFEKPFTDLREKFT